MPSDEDRGLTHAELRELPVVIDLMTAAAVLRLGRTKAYALARSGQFPCRILKIGDTYRVPTMELLRLVGAESGEPESQEPDVA